MNEADLKTVHHLLGRGDHAAAADALAELLTEHPGNLQLLHLAGVAAMQLGEVAQAVDFWQQAVAVDDQRAVLFSNLGAAQQALGEREAALRSLRRAVELDPGSAVNHYNLGLALYEADEVEEAESAFRHSIALDPRQAKTLYNLANLLQEQGGRDDEAEQLYREVIALAPDIGNAHHNLAVLLAHRGAIDEAIERYQRAVEEGVAIAAVFLGDLYQLRRQPLKAQGYYREALQVDPLLADAHGKLGALLLELGDRERGLTHIVKSLQIAPQRIELWQTFARATGRLPVSPDPRYSELIEKALGRRGVDPGFLARPACGILEERYQLNDKFATPGARDVERLLQTAAGVFTDPLLGAVLRYTLVTSSTLEQCLTDLRRAALLERDHAFFADNLPLLAMLATQCFYNEFVWAETEAEANAIKDLRDKIIQSMRDEHAIDPLDLCALGCYQALSALPDCEKINEREWPEPVADFLHDTLAADLVERNLLATIPTITTIAEPTSQQVRAQYEESPYPRWLRVESKLRGDTAATLRATFPEIDYACGSPPRVLVAGCGTGRHVADVGWHYADAEILAIDLSRASLAYAKRMIGVYGHDNVEFKQADLLHLGELDTQFDVIECSGVLHHLAEPLRGWRVLVERLRPGGFMRVGLYSHLARRPVHAARELIEREKLPADLAGIRTGRAAIRALGPDHATFPLTRWYDFCSTSSCRDLIFHVQEVDYRPLELDSALRELGLQFLGFNLLTASQQKEYIERFPDDPKMLNLANWEEFEQDWPNIFIGMYQFWCRKPA